MSNATQSKRIVIIAGPNGAGKTTFAREFLPNIFEHHGQNVTSKGNNGANVVQSHHERTRLNPPYCYTERPTTHRQDKINTWTTSTAFESVATSRL